jgi:23S rRNA pseudouridine1911/1915/1917 synthase
VARNDTAHAGLAEQFAERKLVKEYLGLCVGECPPDTGVVEGPIGRSRRDPTKLCVRKGGKEARTDYERLNYQSGISLMRFRPRTGRTHQVRVHASHAGYPIVCDPVYGGDREAVKRVEPADRPFAYKVYKCFARHALHAHTITFAHPRSGATMTVVAAPPADFTAALRLFEKQVKL